MNHYFLNMINSLQNFLGIKSKKVFWIFCFLLILTLITRLYYNKHCIWVDEARDLDVARNIAYRFKISYGDEPFTKHPFFYHLTIAVLMRLFGITVFAGTLATILFSLLLVISVFYLGKYLFDETVGVLSSLLIAFHPLVWFLSDRVLIDVPYISLIATSAVFFIKYLKHGKNKDLYLCSIITGLSVMTKLPSALIIFIYAVSLIKKRGLGILKKSAFLKSVMLFAVIISPYFIHNYFSLGILYNIEEFLRWGAASAGEVDVQSFNYYISNYKNILRFPFLIISSFGILAVFLKRKKFDETFFLISWLIIYFIVLSFMSVKVPRYLLPIFPPLAVLGGVGLQKMRKEVDSVSKGAGVVILICAVLIFAYFSFSEIKVLIPIKAEGFCGFEEAGKWIAANTGTAHSIIAGSPQIIHFYSDRNNVYSFPQDFNDFISLLNDVKPKYVEVDLWERPQPSYVFEFITPDNPNFLLVKTVDLGKSISQNSYGSTQVFVKENAEPVIFIFEYIPSADVVS